MSSDQSIIFGGQGQPPRTLKIEFEGGMVHIMTGLTDADGRRVSRVDISPDDETRGGDGSGHVWHLQDGNRLVRQGEQTELDPSDGAEQYRWALATSGPIDDEACERIAFEIDNGNTHGLYVHGD